jgi:hypothetical protein
MFDEITATSAHIKPVPVVRISSVNLLLDTVTSRTSELVHLRFTSSPKHAIPSSLLCDMDCGTRSYLLQKFEIQATTSTGPSQASSCGKFVRYAASIRMEDLHEVERTIQCDLPVVGMLIR